MNLEWRHLVNETFLKCPGAGEDAAPALAQRVWARVVIVWEGGTGSGVELAAAAGGVPPVAVAVSLQGRLGWRTPAGGREVACGVVVGVAAMAMAASTRGRHCVRLRDPGRWPLGLVPLMLKVCIGEPGALGSGGFCGRMVAEIMLLYVCERRCRSPPPLLRGWSKARA
jgi:hypothetical protein